MTFRRNSTTVTKFVLDLLNGIYTVLDPSLSGEDADLIFRISKEGKILSVFCNYINVFPERFHNYLENRCRLTELYMEYSEIISNELSDGDVEFYFFKTFKPFPYDLTDIDVLLMNRKEIFRVADILIRKLGFKVVSRGTYSLTLRKSIDCFDIDLDLQPGIYAGTFEYLPISEIRKIFEIGHIRRGVPLLRPELELAVISGHAFFKDFKITLANMVYLDHLLKSTKNDVFLFIASNYPYLAKAITILSDMINVLKFLVANQIDTDDISDVNVLLYKSVSQQINAGKGIFKIPLIYIVKMYHDVFLTLLEKRDFRRIKELVSLPSSRGIKTIFERLGIIS